VTTQAAMSRAEVLALPPTHSLETLGRALGVSGPTIRAQHRNGQLEALGIKVVRLGAQYRVITASLWDFLGLHPGRQPEARPPSQPGSGPAVGGSVRVPGSGPPMSSRNGGYRSVISPA
jgi:hypothetical protein